MLNQDEQWNGTDGVVAVVESVEVPNGRTLTIAAGTEVVMNPGVSIEVVNGGSLLIQGKPDQVVRLLSSDPPLNWGRISASGGGSRIIIEHADFSHGQLVFLDGAEGRVESSVFQDYIQGDKAIVKSILSGPLVLRGCHFRRYYELQLSGAVVVIEHCLFENPTTDAIDIDGAPPGSRVADSILRFGLGPGVDGLDMDNGSTVLVERCRIHHFTDKGISIGAVNREITVRDTLIYRVGTGIAVKDDSYALLENNTLAEASVVGLHLYEKNAGLGGGRAIASNLVLWNNQRDVLVENDSTLELTSSILQESILNHGESNLAVSPEFVHPDLGDFQLKSDSPARSAGLSGEDLGARIPAIPPEAPVGFSAEVVDDGGVVLHWVDASDDEIGFELERATPGINWLPIVLLPMNRNRFVDMDAKAGLSFVYRIRSFNQYSSSKFESVALGPDFVVTVELSKLSSDESLRLKLVGPADREAVLEWSVDLVEWDFFFRQKIPENGILEIPGLKTDTARAFYRVIIPDDLPQE